MESAPTAGQQHRRGARGLPRHPLAGLLLRPQALHPCPDRRRPGSRSGRPRHRPHPECPRETVAAADESGSTAYITKAISEASDPTNFAIGTEINLVQRLAAEHPQHTITCLDPVVCPCSTMYRIHPGYIAWVLESLLDGSIVNQVTVDAEVADPARIALDRMLAAKPRI